MITCKLCLEGSPVIFRGSAALHGYDPSKKEQQLVNCADSNFILSGIPTAERGAIQETID